MKGNFVIMKICGGTTLILGWEYKSSSMHNDSNGQTHTIFDQKKKKKTQTILDKKKKKKPTLSWTKKKKNNNTI